MAKLFTYAMISIGILLLFQVAGLQTSGNIILVFLGATSPEEIGSFTSGSFFKTLLVTAVAALGIVGITMGLLGKSVSAIPTTALYSTPFVALIGNLASITSYTAKEGGWISYVIWLIMAPLLVGYAISLYDWIREND